MRINKELLKGSTVILLLKLVEQKSMYGYEMIKALEETSGGIFQFREGTLYPILHTLEQAGMLDAYWSNAESGRQRKYYQITPAGREELREKQQEWEVFRSAMGKVLGEVGV